jgi:hypothetical protein
MAAPLVAPFLGVLLRFLTPFFSFLAKFLLSGLIAKIIFKLILNVGVFGAIWLFYKNFTDAKFEYALSFFNFFGFGDSVTRLQYYWNQLPKVMRDVVSYFQIGAMVGYIVNNYLNSLFLAWIMRRFG